VIFDALVPYRDGTVEESRLHGVQLAPRVSTNRDGPFRAVPLVGEVRVTLEAAKIPENVGESPARVAQCDPAVVVLRSTPLGEARVGRRAAPHDSGSGDRDSSVELYVGGVAPIVFDRWLTGVENIRGESGHFGVVRTRLDQEHSSGGVLTQPRGEHAASGASTDDDGVEPHAGKILSASRAA
jgi:hypothetical protein